MRLRNRRGLTALAATVLAAGILTTIPAARAATTVTYDASGGGRIANSATLTFSHTVSGTGNALLVGAGVGKIGDSACSASATYNGVTMTSQAKEHAFSGSDGFEQVFGLTAPATGTHNVVITVTGCTPTELTGESESFNGAAQTATFGGVSVQPGNGPSPSITTASSASGDMYAGFIAAGHSITGVNFGTSRTIENQDNTTGAGNSASSTIASSGSGVQLGWSLSAGDWWGIVAVQVNQDTGGQMSAPPGYTTKIFEDQFTGTTLDSAKWVTYVGDQGTRWNDNGALPPPYSGPNHGGTGQAMYSPTQDTVSNGLTITAQRNTTSSACGSACTAYAANYPWVSGTINTEGKFSLPTTSAWYLQANIKMPDSSQGMWPAMWSLCSVTCSPENELDAWEGGFDELAGVPANRTAHYDYFSNAGQKASEQDLGIDVSAGYHVYGVAFVPGQSITYYLDGVQKFQVATSSCGCTIPAEPYEIMLNMQVASASDSAWHTVPSASTPATTMQVAEVQAYTP